MEQPLPQEVDVTADSAFGLKMPFSFEAGTGHQNADLENIEWLTYHGMLGSTEAARLYAKWDAATLTCYTYPYASADDLTLATDLMGFLFLFDDQFDGSDRQPDQVAATCTELIGILHRSTGPRFPVARAFADLWARSVHGMSTAWRARAAYHWEQYFAAQASEVVDRIVGAIPTRDHYFALRDAASGSKPALDLCERVGKFTVPSILYCAPHTRQIRRLTYNILNISNDLFSLEKEELRGDVDNFVFVVRAEEKCSREEAVIAAARKVNQWAVAMTDIEKNSTAALSMLGAGEDELRVLQQYVAALKAWAYGNIRWSTESGRFASANYLPAQRAGHLENLLGDDATRRRSTLWP
ncbi:terpene synthase family protein [Nocardia brasiliensis]|uniref:terpene synthase family protein n=1 Tax=Nocardia brasiliensis TaxID=37326 RepID=UPI002454DBEB|nr:hypothetical protein [Nocardia brasiliensis]